MKICFLTSELSSKNGWSQYSVSVIRQAKEKGIDCRVLVSEKNQSKLDGIEIYPVLPPLGSRIGKVFSLLRNFFKIRKLIEECDIVHSLIEPYGPIAFLCGRKPFFITLHGTYAVTPFKKRYLRNLYSKTYQKAAGIICVSRFTKKEFLKNIQLDNVSVINNGVDFKKFQKEGFIKKDLNVISVGALTFRKGYHISIPAIAKVKEKEPGLKYLIIGNQKNQNYFKHLKKLVESYKISDNIIFRENISEEDLVRSYYQSSLFLLTPVNIEFGKFEGFGLVYLEANACGRPVIGTYNCGAQEVIKDGFNGFLVPQNDIKETVRAILKVLDDRELAIKIGRNGIEKAKEMDWSKVIEKYIKIYQSL